MERTSFGMQKKLQATNSSNNTTVQNENKPALPKRSPAPKTDKDNLVSVKSSENTKTQSEDTPCQQTTPNILFSADNNPKTKSIIGSNHCLMKLDLYYYL